MIDYDNTHVTDIGTDLKNQKPRLYRQVPTLGSNRKVKRTTIRCRNCLLFIEQKMILFYFSSGYKLEGFSVCYFQTFRLTIWFVNFVQDCNYTTEFWTHFYPLLSQKESNNPMEVHNKSRKTWKITSIYLRRRLPSCIYLIQLPLCCLPVALSRAVYFSISFPLTRFPPLFWCLETRRGLELNSIRPWIASVYKAFGVYLYDQGEIRW
jgi:hypothetical protein